MTQFEDMFRSSQVIEPTENSPLPIVIYFKRPHNTPILFQQHEALTDVAKTKD